MWVQNNKLWESTRVGQDSKKRMVKSFSFLALGLSSLDFWDFLHWKSVIFIKIFEAQFQIVFPLQIRLKLKKKRQNIKVL